MSAGFARRPVREPGGVLLIGCGLTAEDLVAAAQALYPAAGSLSILVASDQQNLPFPADEVWVFDRLGLRGFLALMRRISWRRFDLVVHPPAAHHGWLRWLIWPRPRWQSAV